MVDIVKQAEEEFKDASEIHADNRREALNDLKFGRLGEQWDIRDVQQRKQEGRPCLTINRLPAFIRQVTNEARQNKPAIKVKPVDSESDVETAEIINVIVRNIETTSGAAIAYETALDYAVSCSIGFIEVATDYVSDESFEQKIKINRNNNPLAVEYDPHAIEADGSDWEFAFILDWMTKDAFKAKWPKKDQVSFSTNLLGSGLFYPQSQEMIRVAKYWKVESEMKTLLMFSDGTVMLEEDALKPHPDTGVPIKEMFSDMGITVSRTRKSPQRKVKSYIIGGDVLEQADWAGKWIPVVPVFGEEVNVDGKVVLRSLIRDAKDPQKMFNYWRTATTEMVALAPKAPYIGPRGAFDSDERWNTANNASHPYLEYDGMTSPQRQQFAAVPAGALQESLNAADDMKSIMGIYDASLGARSNETSGRAIMARQREGDVGTFHYIDNLSRAITHVGRIIVDLIPKIYDKPQVMRILGVDGTPKNVKVNEEFTDDVSGITKIYDITTGEYDVAVDTGPSYTTMRDEFVDGATKLIQANPNMAPLLMDLIAKNLDWPEADEVSRRFKAMLPPEIKQLEDTHGMPPEAQMAISQMQQQMGQLQQQMQQGASEFQKIAQENAMMKMELKNKQGELQIKANEVQVKASEVQLKAQELSQRSNDEQIKAHTDVMVANIEAHSAERVASIEASMQAMSHKMELMHTAMQAREPITINNGSPRKKTVAIQAPSGGVYTGVIEEQDDGQDSQST